MENFAYKNFIHNKHYKNCNMTREEFDGLKVGDKIIHAFGGIGIVTEKEENGYTVKDKGFDCGDGLDEVSFAWNEGKLIKEK